ncbi:MAG: hypothetical protein WAN11_28400 [Syntrophobacteraceae bacterium]
MAKKKINDDTLLQSIRDGNSPAEAASRTGGSRTTRSNSTTRLPSAGPEVPSPH